MRTSRRFIPWAGSVGVTLEVRLAPSALVGVANDDPLPNPDPNPPDPEPEPTDPFPGLPPSGPAGPGT